MAIGDISQDIQIASPEKEARLVISELRQLRYQIVGSCARLAVLAEAAGDKATLAAALNAIQAGLAAKCQSMVAAMVTLANNPDYQGAGDQDAVDPLA